MKQAVTDTLKNAVPEEVFGVVVEMWIGPVEYLSSGLDSTSVMILSSSWCTPRKAEGPRCPLSTHAKDLD